MAGVEAMGAVRTLLADGRRWHFQHGPIDLVIEAWGEDHAVAQAIESAWSRFESILEELVGELPLLRAPITARGPMPAGPVARRMWRAIRPHCPVFVTPMAAVAGAVADEVLTTMVAAAKLRRAYVNDGGDIALHLAPGESLQTGMVTDIAQPAIDGVSTIRYDDPVRGIATSGRGGRSFSLGIADSVTVLAIDAAAADAAATLIANEVDIAHRAVRRMPARELDPDSDLGDRPVTVDVGELDDASIRSALNRGTSAAERMRRAGAIVAAFLTLRGGGRIVGGETQIARTRQKALA